MNDTQQKIADIIREKFPVSFVKAEEFRGDLTVSIRKDAIGELLIFLKENPDTAYDFLVSVTAVDYSKLEGEERFAVIYHLNSQSYRNRLCIQAWVPEDDMNIESAVSLWKTADWQEREAHEMYGIKFENHGDLRPLMLPDDFVGFPLRKDFPLKGLGYRENFPNLKDK